MKNYFFLLTIPFLWIISCKKSTQVPVVSASETTFEEGTSGFVTVSLSNAYDEEVRITVNFSNGAARLNEDFTAGNSGELVFAPGETEKKLDVTIAIDPPEGQEDFKVSLSKPVNATLEKNLYVQTIATDPFNYYWIFFKVDGVPVFMNFNPDKINPVYSNQFFTSGSRWQNSQGVGAALGIGQHFVLYPTEVNLWNFCGKGDKTFARFGNSPETDGFFIEYRDANGVVWTSQSGGHPASDRFTITRQGDQNGTFYDFTYNGTFTCTVYDGNGNFKILTNGSFYAATPSSI